MGSALLIKVAASKNRFIFLLSSGGESDTDLHFSLERLTLIIL